MNDRRAHRCAKSAFFAAKSSNTLTHDAGINLRHREPLNTEIHDAHSRFLMNKKFSGRVREWGGGRSLRARHVERSRGVPGTINRATFLDERRGVLLCFSFRLQIIEFRCVFIMLKRLLSTFFFGGSQNSVLALSLSVWLILCLYAQSFSAFLRPTTSPT